MARTHFLILFMYSVLVPSLTMAKELNVPGSSNGGGLPFELLQEFTKRSELYTDLSFPYGASGDPSFAKTQSDLNAGVLDVMWTATSESYESEFQAVYVPIYRGTLGMRIGIIEKNKRDLFKDVVQASDFKKYTACQGKLWADTPVLEANGVKVAKSLKYFNIFAMVEADRCDYFPRAIFEPWGEIEREAKYELMVDEYVMIRYTMPFLYFVKKDNQLLADEMTRVFAGMLEDGTYERLFFNDSDVKNALNLANLNNRVVFDFENPYLTQDVKAIPGEYWFDPLGGE